MGSKVLCVEVRSSSTRICEVEYRKKDKPKIYSILSFENPEGTVEDGFITDIAKYAEAMKKLLDKHEIESKEIVFSVMSGKIANREVILPMITEKKLPQVIAIGAEEYFPFDLSSYVVTHKILEKMNQKDEKQLRVLVLAAPTELIRCYHELAETLELGIAGMDYCVNGYFQIIKKELYRGLNLAIHITDDSSILTVVDNGVMTMQRVIPFGAMKVVESVTEQPIFRRRTMEEAFDYLCRETLINYRFTEQQKENDIYMVGSESVGNMRQELYAKEYVTATIRYLVNNISRVLDYYSAKKGAGRISTIYLTGSGAKFNGIDRLLSNELGYEVRKMDNIYFFDFAKDPRIDRSQVIDCISCIGAGIQPVGFTLEEELDKKEMRSNKISMSLIFALSVVLSIVLIIISKYSQMSAKWELEKLDKKISEKSVVQEKYKQHAQARPLFDNAQTFLNLTKAPSDNLNELISELEANFPTDMTVTSLNYHSGKVGLVMSSSKKITIAKLLMQFYEIDGVRNVVIPSLTQGESENGAIKVDFSVFFDYGVVYVNDVSQEQNNSTSSDLE